MAAQETPVPLPRLHKVVPSAPPSLPHPVALFADLTAWIKSHDRSYPDKYDPEFYERDQDNPERPLAILNWDLEKEKNYVLLRHAFLTLHGAVTYARNTVFANNMIPYHQRDLVVDDCDDLLDAFRIVEIPSTPETLEIRPSPFLVDIPVSPALTTGVFDNDNTVALEYLEKRLKPATAKVTGKFYRVIDIVHGYTLIVPRKRLHDPYTGDVDEDFDPQEEISTMSILAWRNLLRVLNFAFSCYHRDAIKAMADIRIRLNRSVTPAAGPS